MSGAVKFQVKLLDKRGLPVRATPMSAGYDVVACIDVPVVIRKGDKATLIPLGFACFMADGNVAGLILPRSGLGHKQGLTLGNTVGVVDGDYQNQWFASAWNRGQQDEIVINPGDKLAQIVFVPVIHPDFEQVEEFAEETERGLGGFGSTGVNSAADEAILPSGGEIDGPGVILSACDAEFVADLVDNPPEPNEALKAAAAKFEHTFTPVRAVAAIDQTDGHVPATILGAISAAEPDGPAVMPYLGAVTDSADYAAPCDSGSGGCDSSSDQD